MSFYTFVLMSKNLKVWIYVAWKIYFYKMNCYTVRTLTSYWFRDNMFPLNKYFVSGEELLKLMDSLLCITLCTWNLTGEYLRDILQTRYSKKKAIYSVCMKQNYNYIKMARSLIFGDERYAIKLAERKITIDYEDRLHGLWFVMLL